MNQIRFQALTATLIAATLIAGCAAEPNSEASDRDLSVAAPQQAPGTGVALRIEQAARKLTLGGDIAEARTQLEALTHDPAATPEEREDARLELSVAFEIEGNREAAIQTVEALLSEHADGRPWAKEARAESRLRQSLTGSPDAPKSWPRAYKTELAPFARVLAKYFPVETGHDTQVTLYLFGGNEEETQRIGAFDISRALREEKRQSCPLCPDLSIHTTSARNGSWTGIPRLRTRLGSGLAVYYMTLGSGRIPARYDAELPIPSAAIEAHLQQGKGLFVARERNGAPPSIVIAAPRESQLAKVEEALALMKSLPTEPNLIPLPMSLSPEEIQVVVRAQFPAYRACYEALLAQKAKVSGRISMKFAIHPDGTMAETSIGSVEGDLVDATFHQCMLAATSSLVFPAALEKTDVVYPIQMTPGDDS